MTQTKKNRKELISDSSDEESSDIESDDDEEAEEENEETITIEKSQKTNVDDDKEEDDDDDDDEGDDDEEEDDDGDDDGDNDGEEEEEERDEADEEEEEEESDESEEEQKASTKSNKRKKETETKSPVKKQKMSNNEELSNENTIYVSNLSPEVTLKKFQKSFPEASSIRFPTKYDGASKGFAFLVFDKEKTLKKCLSEKQSLEMSGKKILLTVAGDTKTMYVKGINRAVTEAELQKTFPDAANINYPVTNNGKPKGYAFIQFDSEAQMKTTVSRKQGLYLKGDKLFLDIVSNRKKNPQTFRAHGDIKRDGYIVSEEPTKTITVRNLSYDLTDSALIKQFECLTSNLITDPETEQSKGRAYLNFKSKRHAKEAVRSFNNKKLEGRIVYIYYAKKTGKSSSSKGKKKKNTNQEDDDDEEEEDDE